MNCKEHSAVHCMCVDCSRNVSSTINFDRHRCTSLFQFYLLSLYIICKGINLMGEGFAQTFVNFIQVIKRACNQRQSMVYLRVVCVMACVRVCIASEQAESGLKIFCRIACGLQWRHANVRIGVPHMLLMPWSANRTVSVQAPCWLHVWCVFSWVGV